MRYFPPHSTKTSAISNARGNNCLSKQKHASYCLCTFFLPTSKCTASPWGRHGCQSFALNKNHVFLTSWLQVYSRLPFHKISPECAVLASLRCCLVSSNTVWVRGWTDGRQGTQVKALNYLYIFFKETDIINIRNIIWYKLFGCISFVPLGAAKCCKAEMSRQHFSKQSGPCCECFHLFSAKLATPNCVSRHGRANVRDDYVDICGYFIYSS